MMNTETKARTNVLPPVMSVQDLADVLKIGRNRAYALVKSGKIRVVHIGKHIRISQAALLEYLDSSSVTC